MDWIVVKQNFGFIYIAGVPEWSKGVDSSSTAQASWVQIPPPAILPFEHAAIKVFSQYLSTALSNIKNEQNLANNTLWD